MSKPKKKKKRVNLNLLVCNRCGGMDLESKAWVNPNTLKFLAFEDEPEDYCNRCCDYVVTTDRRGYLQDQKSEKL